LSSLVNNKPVTQYSSNSVLHNKRRCWWLGIVDLILHSYYSPMLLKVVPKSW